jgi:bacitracin transport system ATP-binding protein
MNMLNEPVLMLSSLGKKYDARWAVQDLNLTVYKGEIYGFLGRNGAGKTTTIRMIMNLIKPTTGDIQLFGIPKANLGKNLFRRIGATIEYPGFYLNLTATENLYYNAKMFGVAQTRIGEVLSFMGLADAANRVVKGFSLGMRQRLGLARALLHNPDSSFLMNQQMALTPQGLKKFVKLLND